MNKRLILDLFSGIGGFSLAAEWVGWETIGFCEQDPFCQKVLAKHWPGVPIHDDIRTLDADMVMGWTGGRPVWGIVGGWPCQPFSVAGKQRGAEDDRHLWPEFNRIVGELGPDVIVGENVPGFIGLALDQVLADLEAQGYATGTVVLPAAGVNAPHRRDRVWIVGYAGHHESSSRRERANLEGQGVGWGDQRRRSHVDSWQESDGSAGEDPCLMAHAESERAGEPHHQAHAEPDSGEARQVSGIGSDGAGRTAPNPEREQGGQRPDADVFGGWAGEAEQIGVGGGGDLAPDATPRGIRRGSAPGEAGQPAQPRQDVPHANGTRPQGHGGAIGARAQQPRTGSPVRGAERDNGHEAVSSVGRSHDGLPGRLVERAIDPRYLDPRWEGNPMAAFGDDWESGAPRVTAHETQRVAKLKALGNSLVPQVAYQLFKALSCE